MVTFAELGPDALAAVADENFVVHAGWVQRRGTSMRLVERPELVLIDSGQPCDTFNIVCRARLHGACLHMGIEQAVGYFAAAGRPFAWWVGPADQPADLGEHLVAAGLERAESEQAMAADLDTLRPSNLTPDDLVIQRVRTVDHLRDFAGVLAPGASTFDREMRAFYHLAAPIILVDDAPLWLYVGYLDGVPVVTSQLTVGGGVVGLYNVVTLATHRRRGYGSALTMRPLVDAHAHGYRVAVLQASGDGERVYARLGFRSFGTITEYKPSTAEPLD